MAASNSQPDLTSKEFASKVKSLFVLRGPRPPDEPTEGGSTDHNAEDVAGEALEGSTPIEATTGTLLNIVSQSLQGTDLPAELRGQYDQDPAFQPIIARPKDFRNFEVDGQLIYLKRQGGRVLQCERAHLQQVYFDLGNFLSIFLFFSGKETDENMTIYAISEFFPRCFTFSTRIEKKYATLYCGKKTYVKM